jgi:hypothetical protein
MKELKIEPVMDYIQKYQEDWNSHGYGYEKFPEGSFKLLT